MGPRVCTGSLVHPGAVQKKPFDQESHPTSSQGAVGAPTRSHEATSRHASRLGAGRTGLAQAPSPQGCTGLASARGAYRPLLPLHYEYKTAISGQALSH